MIDQTPIETIARYTLRVKRQGASCVATIYRQAAYEPQRLLAQCKAGDAATAVREARRHARMARHCGGF